MHIEFHLTASALSELPERHPPQGQQPHSQVYTENVVIRLRPELPVKTYLMQGRGSLSEIDGELSHLPRLRTVTLESVQHTSHSGQLAEKFTSSRADGRLRTRTCQESYALALAAQEGVMQGNEAISVIWTDPALRGEW